MEKPDFKISVTTKGASTPINILTKYVKFSDGTFNIFIDPNVRNVTNVLVNICTTNTLLAEKLSYFIGHLIKVYYPGKKALISFEYLPHGRADRIFEEGGISPLHNFLVMLGCYYNHLHVVDPHNLNAVVESFSLSNERVTIKSQTQTFYDTFASLGCLEKGKWVGEKPIIVSPDKGAEDKANAIDEAYGQGLIRFNKCRNETTGVIEFIKPIEDQDLSIVKEKTVIVCDDICDGGGTFIPISEKLVEYNPKELILFTTFGIYSKGVDLLLKHYDNVFCYTQIERRID